MANIATATAQAGMCYYLTANELDALGTSQTQRHFYVTGLPARMTQGLDRANARFLPDTVIRDKDGKVVKDADGNVKRWKTSDGKGKKEGMSFIHVRTEDADGNRVTQKVSALEYAEAELIRKGEEFDGKQALQLTFQVCEGEAGLFLVCYFKEGKLKVSDKKLF